VPVALRAQLDAQTADVAVQLQQADWYVPWMTSSELRCTANVFGMDPRHTTTVAAVTTAYALIDCSDRDSADIDTGSIDIVLAERLNVPVHDAFTVLRSSARSGNRRLSELAQRSSTAPSRFRPRASQPNVSRGHQRVSRAGTAKPRHPSNSLTRPTASPRRPSGAGTRSAMRVSGASQRCRHAWHAVS
jgi:hypothetical protein